MVKHGHAPESKLPFDMPQLSRPGNAIRADASAGRRASLVGHSLDPVTGFPRLFNLLSTFPWRLRQHSAFLALHFGMLGMFALLLLGYTLLAMWPLAAFVRADKYRTQFRLSVGGNDSFCNGVLDNVTGEDLIWKDKEYLTNSWGSNLVLKTSLGNLCGPHSFSNALDCGDTCTIAPHDLDALEKSNGMDRTKICRTTYPCSTPCGTNPDGDDDMGTADTKGICCVFGNFKFNPAAFPEDKRREARREAQRECNPTFTQLEDRGIWSEVSLQYEGIGDEEKPRKASEALLQEFRAKTKAHVWLWCVPGMLFFVAWITFLQYMQQALAEAGNQQNINVSQYAVMISNVGGVEVDDDRLKDFGRYYGDVVAAFHIRNYGRYLAKNVERQTAQGLLRELERVKQECVNSDLQPGITIQRRFTTFPASWFFWLYKRFLCWHMSVDDSIKSLEEKNEKLGEEICELSNRPDEPTGNAIIVFNWVHNAANMLYDHNIRNSLANLFVPPSAGQFFNIATGGTFARTPKIILTEVEGGQRSTIHRYVSVSRAPEPNDLWWESSLYGGWPIVRRRVLAWFFYFALLGVAFAVQAMLAFFSANENRDNVNKILVELREYSDAEEENLGLLSQLNFDTLDSLKWTITKAVLTLCFSAAGILLIHFISDFSLFIKHTRNEASTITKIALFQLINSFVVPVVAFLASGSDSFSLWYTKGGLAELAFLVQVGNAFAGSIAFLFRVDDMFYLHFLSHMACSKPYASMYMHPPAFRMNLRLGQAVTTVGLSILYAPILPLSPVIGLLGMLFQYGVDQFIALRHSSKPRAFQVEALTGTNYVLRMLPLAQLILIWALYFNFDRGSTRDAQDFSVSDHMPEILGLVIWSVACILPLMHRTRQVEYRRWVEGGRPRLLVQQLLLQTGKAVKPNYPDATNTKTHHFTRMAQAFFRRLLDWAKPPGQKQATWTNHAQMTSTLNAVPDLPKGFRLNYDTYLPDVPSLDSEIFTTKLKPHFTYHSPPLPQTRFVQQPGSTAGAIGSFAYEQVAPNEQLTMALARATVVDAPDALAKTSNFRRTELAETPEIVQSGKPDAATKWFTPGAHASGVYQAAPQTFVPGEPTGEAAVHKPAPVSKKGPPASRQPSQSRPEARPAAFDPEAHNVAAAVFVPDDVESEQFVMPLPPDQGSAQQGRGQKPYGGDRERKTGARGMYAWGGQLHSQ